MKKKEVEVENNDKKSNNNIQSVVQTNRKVIPLFQTPWKEEEEYSPPTPSITCNNTNVENNIIAGNLNNLPTVISDLADIIPYDSGAFNILEQSILKDGVINPLVAAKINGKTVLLDGHMRLEIILKHKIKDFKLIFIDIKTIDQAKWWMVEHCFTYRQLNKYQRIEMALEQEPYLKKLAAENKSLAGKHKGNLSKLDKPFIPIDCLKIIAKRSNSSKQTVDDVRYIKEHGKPYEVDECRRGEVKISSMRKRIRDRKEASNDEKNKRNAANDKVKYVNPKESEFYNQIINGDCLKVLDDMDFNDIRVDLGITSPPYFGAKKDYGKGFQDFTLYNEYLHFMGEFIYKFQRVGTPGMRLCINVDSLNNAKAKPGEDYIHPVSHDLVRIVHELNSKNSDCNLRFLGEITWFKNHAGGKVALGSYSPMKPVIRNDSESILVWVKGQKEFTEINENVIIEDCNNPEYLLTKDEYHKFTRKTWQIGTNSDKYRHPAKFPEEIPHRLIKLFTSPQDTILDPFCGAGTTCVAAKKLKRNFIGIDKVEGYCQISRDRVEDLDREDVA